MKYYLLKKQRDEWVLSLEDSKGTIAIIEYFTTEQAGKDYIRKYLYDEFLNQKKRKMHDCSQGCVFCISFSDGRMVIEDTRYALQLKDFSVADIQVNYCPFCGEKAEVQIENSESP